MTDFEQECGGSATSSTLGLMNSYSRCPGEHLQTHITLKGLKDDNTTDSQKVKSNWLIFSTTVRLFVIRDTTLNPVKQLYDDICGSDRGLEQK